MSHHVFDTVFLHQLRQVTIGQWHGYKLAWFASFIFGLQCAADQGFGDHGLIHHLLIQVAQKLTVRYFFHRLARHGLPHQQIQDQ